MCKGRGECPTETSICVVSKFTCGRQRRDLCVQLNARFRLADPTWRMQRNTASKALQRSRKGWMNGGVPRRRGAASSTR